MSYYTVMVKGKQPGGFGGRKSKNSRQSTPSSRGFLIKLAVLFLLIPPFFSTTFVKSGSLRVTFLLASFIILLYLAARCEWVLLPSISLVAAALFFVFFAVRNGFEGTDNWRWFIYFGISLGAAALLESVRDCSWVEFFLKALLALGTFYALISIICWLFPNIYESIIFPKFFAGLDRHITGRGYRAGFTNHYSTNAMYLANGLIAAFALSLNVKFRGRWTVAFLTVLFALVLIAKRAHLAFGLASIVLLYLAFGSGKKFSTFSKIAMAAVAALFLFFCLQYVIPELSLVVDRFLEAADDDTLNGRTPFYALCFEMWEKAPLFGSGFGSFSTEFNKTSLGLQYFSRGFEEMDAHNVYFQVLAECGSVGFVLFCTCLFGGIYSTLRVLLRMNRSQDDSVQRNRSLLAGCLGLQIFFALYCLTGNPLYDMQTYIPWLLALGGSRCIARYVYDIKRLQCGERGVVS